ncbi:MAG TPA: autotransporter-associated beta strand repeat-containing protein, partial [Candidatus Anammoximicrobium sp.]|nr:autotransporter-associated beta strand repeat-containing protein [Candidatus Anammoximicrobium sp.]
MKVLGFSFDYRAAQRKLTRARRARSRRQRSLLLERLEDRRLLAAFSESDSTLNIDLTAASERVGIVSNGTSYSLTLDAPNVWSGIDTANVTGNGWNTLTVTAAGLAVFDTIMITDSSSGCAVDFNNSGTNAYSDDFTMVLDASPAGQITFHGASAFGASNLSASTTANIVVSTGAGVTAGSGSVTLTADSMDIEGTIAADGGITLQPWTPSRTIGLSDAAGEFNLTVAELANLSSTGTVVIGRSGGTGAITIGSTAAVSLSAEDYSLTLRGGDLAFSRYLELPPGKTVTLQTGRITSAASGVDITAGAVVLDAGGTVGAGNNPLALAVDTLQGTVNGNLFLRESDSLTISGPLSAAANTIQLESGTFALGASNLLDDASRLYILGAGSPATLALGDSSDTVAGVTLGSATTIGNISGSPAAALTILSDFQLQRGTISARLAESEFAAPVGIVKTTSGTVTLSNVEGTFTGPTTISGGTLTISDDGCLGTPPAAATPGHLIIDGGTLAVSATMTLAATRGIQLGGATGTGTFRIPSDATLTYDGVIADNGIGSKSLTKRGLGTLVLGGDNTYSGATLFADTSSGVVQINHDRALGLSGTISFNGSGTLRYGPGITTDLSSRISTGSSAVTASIDTNGNDVTFGTAVNLSGRLAKVGSGTLTYAAPDTTNVFVLYVIGGELAVVSGTINTTGSTSGGGLTGISDLPTSVFLKDATLSIAGGTLSTDTLLAGKASAFSTGTSPWKLDVSSGTLHARGDLVTTLGTSGEDFALVTIRGGTTQVDGNLIIGWDSKQRVDVSDGTLHVAGNLVVGRYSQSWLNVSGGTVTTSSLRHENSGLGSEVNLTGGVVIAGEVLHQVIQATSLATNDSFIINLEAGGTLVTDRVYVNRTVTGATHTLELRFDGGTLRKLSASADHNLIDAPQGTGGTADLKVVIEDGGALIDIDSGGSDSSADVVQSLQHDSDLDQIRDGGLVKQGADTLTLLANNTFTGPAIVTEGTLALVNTSSNNTLAEANLIDVQFATYLDVTGLDNGTVTGTMILADGQTLMGEGTVTGNLIAGSGSTVTPGPGPGILYEVGDYTMNAGSTLEIEIGGDQEGNDSNNHDQMDVTGAVRLENATLNVSSFNGYVPQFSDEYVIINNDGDDPVIGTFAGLPEGTLFPNFLDSGLTAKISYVAGDGNNDVVISFFGAPSIALVKVGTFQDENGNGDADQGETIRYAFTVSNTGNQTLTDVTLSDTVGGVMLSGDPLATLAVGAVDSTTFTGTYTI